MARALQVTFRGVQMTKGWPQKIEAAQSILSYKLRGRPISRIRYGDEHDDWGANEHSCDDCAVIKGEFHVPHCDGEECPACGGQLISCECPFDDVDRDS